MNKRRTHQETINDTLADARVARATCVPRDRKLWDSVIARLLAKGAQPGGTTWEKRLAAHAYHE